MGHCWSDLLIKNNSESLPYVISNQMGSSDVELHSVLKRPSLDRKISPWEQRWLKEPITESDDIGLTLSDKTADKISNESDRLRYPFVRNCHSLDESYNKEKTKKSVKNRTRSSSDLCILKEENLNYVDKKIFGPLEKLLSEAMPSISGSENAMRKNVSFNDLVVKFSYDESEGNRHNHNKIYDTRYNTTIQNYLKNFGWKKAQKYRDCKQFSKF